MTRESNLARVLAIEWDNQEFHLVSANIRRGKVHFERAVQWRQEVPFTPGQAEEYGKRLRQRLSEAGISPAPVIVSLGRDRMVVKEIRYPQVAVAEEPTLVRMQVVKDLTDSPNDVYIDYCPLAEPDRSGQRRALSLVVRKDVIHTIQDTCRAAGLKVLAITARPFGIAACVKRVAGSHAQVPAPPTADAVVAVLTVAQGWAEFCAVRGEQLLFARSMTAGDGLFGEVRRNLAAYAGQPQLTFPRDAIQALYVTGNGENAVLREKLQATLGIPVHGLDPFVNEERIDAAPNTRAGFTGVVGLLQMWAERRALPANFVKPREARPVTSPHKKRMLVYGSLAAAALVALLLGGNWLLAQDRDKLDKLRESKVEADRQLKGLQPEAKYLEALKEWVDGDVSDLDEFYDLVARAPWVEGFRITKVVKTVVQQTKLAKEKDKDKESRYLVRFDITIKVLRKDKNLVQDWVTAINKDPHCKANSSGNKTIGANLDPENAVQEYLMTVEVARQSQEKYNTLLKTPPKR
jgi:Tfp pilus assembly PilM family ATPase